MRKLFPALAGAAALVGLTAAAEPAIAAQPHVSTQSLCRGSQTADDTPPTPHDAHSTNASADCAQTGNLTSSATFRAWDEILTAYDHSADHRYAYAELHNLATGKTYRVQDETMSLDGTERNLSLTDGNRIKIRVCEGSSTDVDKYGCSAWAYATA